MKNTTYISLILIALSLTYIEMNGVKKKETPVIIINEYKGDTTPDPSRLFVRIDTIR